MNVLFESEMPGTVEGVSKLVLSLHSVLEAMGFTARRCYYAELVAEELGADILRNSGAQTLHLRLEQNADTFLFKITYDGKSYDPVNEAETPDLISGLGERRSKGLGLRLVRMATESQEHGFENGRNRLTLVLKSF